MLNIGRWEINEKETISNDYTSTELQLLLILFHYTVFLRIVWGYNIYIHMLFGVFAYGQILELFSIKDVCTLLNFPY